MTFSKPVPITDAMTLNAVKSVLPSTLDSAGLSALARVISERAIFSARVQLQEALRQISYTPAAEDAGTIKDLSTSGRLNLILDTNVATATGFGRDLQAQDPDVIDAFPAQELYRAIDVQEPRDWPTRWRMAAEIANDPKAMTALGKDGRMIALKSSPIWAALGNTDNFSDALGNDYAPFAWNSGMRTRDIDRLEAQDLGLLAADERIEPRRSPEDFNTALSASGNLPENLRNELLREFVDLVQFDGEVLTLKTDSPTAPPPPPTPAAPQASAVAPTRPPAVESVIQKMKASGFSESMLREVARTPKQLHNDLASLKNVVASDSGESAFYKAGEIHMSTNPDDVNGLPVLFHHEFGRHIHTGRNIVSRSSIDPAFEAAIKADRKLINKMTDNDPRFGPLSDLRIWDTISRRYGPMGYKYGTMSNDERVPINRIIDTIGGITKGDYGYGHEIEYYQKFNGGAAEVFAHTYAAIVYDDQVFQNMFPNCVKFIKETLGL